MAIFYRLRPSGYGGFCNLLFLSAIFSNKMVFVRTADKSCDTKDGQDGWVYRKFSQSRYIELNSYNITTSNST